MKIELEAVNERTALQVASDLYDAIEAQTDEIMFIGVDYDGERPDAAG